jgi:hypothetical protein
MVRESYADPIPFRRSKNCSQLRKVSITIGVQDGSLIEDANQEDNQWTNLISQMSRLGCKIRPLKLLVAFTEAAFVDRPAADALRRIAVVMALIASPTTPDEFAKSKCFGMCCKLASYVNVLKVMHSRRVRNPEEGMLVYEGIDVAKTLRLDICASETFLSTGSMPDGNYVDFLKAAEDVKKIMPWLETFLFK